MTIRRTEIVVLLILLMQVVATVTAGPRPVIATHIDDHGAHTHAPWHAPSSCHSHTHTSNHAHYRAHAASHTPAPSESACLAPLTDGHCEIHCCRCPHAHHPAIPLSSTPPRTAKSSLPRPSPLAALLPIPLDEPRAPLRPRRIRHLEADHPPPVGLKTTRLLI